MADNAASGGEAQEEAVMPMQGVQEQSQSQSEAAEAIVPKDAARFAGQREALGELPVAPAAAAAGEDAVMQEAEDEEGDGDDLFG